MTLAVESSGLSESAAPSPDVVRLTHVDSIEAVNVLVTGPLLDRERWRRWWIALIVSALLTCIFFGSMLYLFVAGIGIFGNNSIVVWGFPIANYVWWIGIGNAGTLISSMLLLTHQHWRAAINRFAEAMLTSLSSMKTQDSGARP